MLQYVNSKQSEALQSVVQTLAQHYADSGSWEQLHANPRLFHQMLRQSDEGAMRPRHRLPPPRPGRHEELLGNQKASPGDERRPLRQKPPKLDKYVLTDVSGAVVLGRQIEGMKYVPLAIEVQGNRVGTLSFRSLNKITEGFELGFVEQQRQTLWIAAAMLLLMAAIFSYLLARNLVEPVKRLAANTREMAKGNYAQLDESTRKDELGSLTRDLNHLSRSLSESESLRNRWVADTSHELRTPVALLRAEIEAMQDGIRPLDRNGLDSMHHEVLRLARLIDDLQQLSILGLGSFQYQMENLDLGELLGGIIERHRTGFKKLDIGLDSALADGAFIYADRARLEQLFDNLLHNSLKYTDSGGRVSVFLKLEKDQCRIIIEDSAPGVSETQLGQLFDYLYRGEESRSRESGGSGLGLSICKRIVEAHQGQISAVHSDIGGVAITLTFKLIHR